MAPVSLLLLALAGDSTVVPASIVPRPAQITYGAGGFQAGPETAVVTSPAGDDGLATVAALTRRVLANGVGQGSGSPDTLRIERAPAGEMPDEAYRLTVTERTLTIRASGDAGAFYGVQTLRQLLPLDGSGRIPAVSITDAPRFRYRGMHLDVGRHLFPVAFIKRYIDLLARYKFNVFHWHLTDDQGWRLEIKRYPRLTQVGAWRRETVLGKQLDPYVGDGQPFGGFYTQDEVRDVVAYAAARHVTIVPEIELPGHAKAALAAYPSLACTPGPFEVSTVWGVDEDIYCPSEETFTFLENVLSEVMDLFPGPYIHIGGDEVPKRRWHESALAQEVMRREGLRDEEALQSWFIRRIATFVQGHGRRIIGWDEILQGGLPPDATVMSWRGTAGGIAAARQGHDVIMTPGSHLYFDHYQGPEETEPLAIGGFTPLARVYQFEPVPPGLTPAEAVHILGAQGNVWTEYITTPEQVEYMVFPRMLALAEVTWSPRDVRDWHDFVGRLPAQLRRLDGLGVHYRIPEPLGLDDDRLVLGDSATIPFATPLPGARVLWSSDASGMGGPGVTDGPVTIPVGRDGARVTARLVLEDGRLGPPVTAHFHRTTLHQPVAVDPSELTPGLSYAYYARKVSRAAALEQFTPTARDTATTIGLKGTERAEDFGVRLSGLLRVPTAAVYEFALTSDDGSLLRIAGVTVIDHDGPHGARVKTGSIALGAGLHPFEVAFFQGGGDRSLDLQVRTNGQDWAPVPPAWLYRRR